MRNVSTLLLVMAVGLSACSTQRTPIRTFAEVLPATGVHTISLGSKVGVVIFKPSSDDNIHVHVRLHSQHTSLFGLITSTRGENAAKAATFSHALADGTLTLGMQYGSSTDTSAISEHWTVEMPTGLAIHAHVAAGELNVNGVAGGVDGTVDVGKVDLDVPGGPLEIDTNVGAVKATVHSLDYGSVTMTTSVGKSSLSVDGAAAGSHQKGGARDVLTWAGQGKNIINFQVNVGKIDVALVKP